MAPLRLCRANPLAICVPGTNGNQTDTFTPTTSLLRHRSFHRTARPSSVQSVTFTATVTSLIGGTADGDGDVQGWRRDARNRNAERWPGDSPRPGAHRRSHSITAVYAGSRELHRQHSSAITQTVGQAGSTTVIASSVNPSTFGQAVTFTATVSAIAPGSGTRRNRAVPDRRSQLRQPCDAQAVASLPAARSPR